MLKGISPTHGTWCGGMGFVTDEPLPRSIADQGHPELPDPEDGQAWMAISEVSYGSQRACEQLKPRERYPDDGPRAGVFVRDEDPSLVAKEMGSVAVAERELS